MADNRKVHQGIRMDDGRVLTDPDDVAKEKGLDLERLESEGAIEGFGKAAPKKAEKEK